MLYWTLIGTLLLALGGLGIFIYFVRQGQFEESEEVKYQLFREDDPDS